VQQGCKFASSRGRYKNEYFLIYILLFRFRHSGSRVASIGFPPMVRDLLVIEVAYASDKGMVTVRLRPIDCFFLSFESAEHVVRMVFDYIIMNGRSFRTALRTSFYVNVRHSFFLPSILSGDTGSANVSFFELATGGSRILNGAISGALVGCTTLLNTFA